MPWTFRLPRALTALPIAVFVVGVAVAAGAAAWLRHQVDQEAALAFERRVDLIDAEVNRRLTLAVYGLRGAGGAHASNPPFTRDRFAAYVASRDLGREFPGVRGFGFIEPVAADALQDFEQQVRSAGEPAFEVRRVDAVQTAPLAATPPALHHVLRFLEPAARNPGAVGLDMSSEPRRLDVIDRAVDTGQPALSRPILLVQDARRRPGFLLMVPLFQPGSQPTTPSQRRERLVGLLMAPMVAAEVLDGLSDAVAGGFGFMLSEPGAAGAPGTPIYRHGDTLAPVDAGTGAVTGAGLWQVVRPVQFAGYDATLTVRSNRGFDRSFSTLPSTLVLLGGILASAMLAALLAQQRNGQRRAEGIAKRMTDELARLALVAERTSNAVTITDRALHITWVNDAFTRLYGHTLAQAQGRMPGDLLGTPHTSAEAIATLAQAAAAGSACRVDVVNRTRDGQLVWMDTEVQPIVDAAGRLDGFVEIANDITIRRQNEQRIAALASENDALLGTIHAHMIVSVTDRHGVIVDVNDAFCRISGHARDALIGKTHAVVNSGVQSSAYWAEMWQTIASGEPWRGQHCNRASDGSLYWVDSIVAPVLGADGVIEKYVSLLTDISAGKRVALELAQQHRRLEDIIEGTGAGTWELDLLPDDAGRHAVIGMRVSAPYAAITGRSVAEVLAAAQPSFMALLHVDDADRVGKAMDDHLLGRTPSYASEHRARHHDGHWVWVQSHGKVSERDAKGRPLRISGIALDISVRKQSERDLSRQRRALANVIAGTHAATWEWDVGSGQLHFNEHWMHLVGCSEAELTHSTIESWAACVHPDDLAGVKSLLASHFRGDLPHVECEYRVRHADGRWVWLLTRGKAVSRTADGHARWVAGTHIDISERKAAAADLAASQAFLDQTGRIAGIGGWQVNLQTQALTWSDQTCRIHDLAPGHEPSLDEAIGYYPPAAQAPLQAAIAHSLATGAGFDLELPLVTATGRAIWVRSVGAVESIDGQPVRLVGAFQDITERRQLADEVRRNNQLMSSVLANLPCALSVFDENLQLVLSNPMFGSLLELTPELNRPGSTRFEDIIRFNADRGEYGAGDPEVIVGTALQRIASGVTPHQFERSRADGTVLEVRGAPMPGGGFVTTYTDVTARRRAEAESARSERLLRAAIDAIDEAFVLFDPDDRFVFCNDKYRRIYPLAGTLIVPGARFEDIIRHGAEAGEIPDAVGRVDQWVAERVQAHQAGQTTPLQTLANGRSMRVVERRLPDGHIVGFRIDVTELVRATEAAQAASLAKSHFLANMSHEIRTPMNAILGMLTLLRKTALTPRQSDYAGKTEGAARSLLGLLNDILDFSKIEADKMTLDPQPFALDTLLQDLSVILSATVGAKPVELLFDIDPQVPPRLLGDAMRLQQVLINLCGNALKFTSRGEVVLSIRCLAPAGRLQIAVRDSGIGIAPENQARIFSGFTQAEASTTRRFGGTGLGVVISQRLVALMGGTLQLDSALGRGSCFHFELTFPVVDDSLGTAVDLPSSATAAGLPVSTSTSTTPTAAPAATGALRALVVDDNPLAREVLARMAASLGWRVQSAAGGEQALIAIEAAQHAGQPFEAIFIDWQMPGLDGWQTSRRIREWQQRTLDAAALSQPRSPATSAPTLVVMVTAHGRDMLAQRDESEQSLLDGFLVKPVTATMLQQALDEARGGIGVDAAAPGATGAEDPIAPGTAAGMPADGPSSAPLQRLAGLRLLLVEDNLNNQQVACELLQDEGAQVQLACDGEAAVAAVAAAFAIGGRCADPAPAPGLDLVLMDLQMPVMDGYTATSRIRQSLGLDPQRLPIVAMTANAMASDREACLAAGMNDHIGKPFDIAHLVAMVSRLTTRSTAAPNHRPAAQPNACRPETQAQTQTQTVVQSHVQPPPIAPPSDDGGRASNLPEAVRQAAVEAGVDIDAAVARLGGKPALYRRLLSGFVTELDDAAYQSRAGVERGELGAAARLAHTVRGTAATLGADALAAAAGDTEAALWAAARLIDKLPPDGASRPIDNTAVAAALDTWHAALARATAPLQRLRDALSDAEAGAVVASPAVATLDSGPRQRLERAARADLSLRLQSLRTLLQQSDMAALALHDDLQRHHRASADPALDALDDAVGRLDFAAAAAQCDAIVARLGTGPDPVGPAATEIAGDGDIDARAGPVRRGF